MNVTSVSCASSHMPVDWHSIDWASVQRRVRKLQIRIVKAVQASKWGKVKALQWLLTHSFSGKALAVKRVTENRGKRTAGIDGAIWSTPKLKAEAVLILSKHGYHPKALRRVYIPKRNGKKRPLDIPTMKDRAMQALYKLALDPVAETTADGDSYGFRLHRSTQDAIGRCFTSLAKKAAVQWVLEGDIKSCFNQISHEWLLKHIPMDKAILRKWLKAGYVESGRLFPTESGTPQGGVISPTLANMALDGLERELNQRFRYSNSTWRKLKVKYVRYADDFLITGITPELLEQQVKPVVENFLQERGLRLSPEKTRITHIADGFDFLGVTLRKYQNKLRINPTRESLKAFLRKVRQLIKKGISLRQADLIKMLNPILRGWVNYHKPWAESRILSRIDHEIFLSLWRWAKRRHQNKGLRWIRSKYFVGPNWVFQCGKLKLIKAAGIEKERHIKIKSDANPYDPNWEAYFEKRAYHRTKWDLNLGSKLKSLWLNQKGICIQCKGEITQETGWNIHHLIPRVEGGQGILSNLVLLHPNCHRQVHSLKLKLEKPPWKGFVKA